MPDYQLTIPANDRDDTELAFHVGITELNIEGKQVGEILYWMPDALVIRYNDDETQFEVKVKMGDLVGAITQAVKRHH